MPSENCIPPADELKDVGSIPAAWPLFHVANISLSCRSNNLPADEVRIKVHSHLRMATSQSDEPVVAQGHKAKAEQITLGPNFLVPRRHRAPQNRIAPRFWKPILVYIRNCKWQRAAADNRLAVHFGCLVSRFSVHMHESTNSVGLVSARK